MKYLKKYNEKVSFEESVKSFSETYLSYLVDNGFSIRIHRHLLSVERCNIIIKKREDNFLKSVFKWDDIKDDFIPFVNVLNENFNIANILVEGRYGHAKNCTIEEILNDDIDKQLSNLPKFKENSDNVLCSIVIYVDNIEK